MTAHVRFVRLFGRLLLLVSCTAELQSAIFCSESLEKLEAAQPPHLLNTHTLSVYTEVESLRLQYEFVKHSSPALPVYTSKVVRAVFRMSAVWEMCSSSSAWLKIMDDETFELAACR